jgi:NAD(P)-dependent dehydrogenase (short-subunit alcohol dehydrogenase family)
MVTAGHTAIMTGANHGIGAATAKALARRGCAVLCTFLRVDDPAGPGTPQAYRDHRAQNAEAVVATIRDGGRVELRVAELERRLRMDSTDSGTPSSRERIGAKEARRALPAVLASRLQPARCRPRVTRDQPRARMVPLSPAA